MNFGRKLKKLSWVPGVYLDEKKYECTSYYPVFGEELLHSDYIMLPYGELMRRKDQLFFYFDKYDDIFIRPNSGFKQFAGTVLDQTRFEDGVKLAGFYDVEPELLVVVSGAKEIQKEWRFVIVNQEVVSGSLYRDWTIGPETLSSGTVTKDLILLNSKSVSEICTDENALEYAKKVAKMYNPEPAWTLDVALKNDGDYKIIEIGCFSCAGMYGNDLSKVVKTVTDAAVTEWKTYFEEFMNTCY